VGRFSNLRRKGFAAAIPAIDLDFEQADIGFIPDGWFVENIGGASDVALCFTCVEIEDGNPMSNDKLWLYSDLCFALDSYGCELRLFVFDRYGLNERELPLPELFAQYLVEMHGPAHGCRRCPRITP
jgi:hypothetical protein